MEQDVDIHLGRRLRSRRRILGLSQNDLGQVLGVRFQQIQKYECGANRVSAARLWELAKILDVSIDYFFDGLGAKQVAAPALSRERIELMERQESKDLIRVYNQMKEQPRRQLLDLAKALNDNIDAN